jgi:NAD(P)-dependent dehydrogenase (short-subunit alcohol dehydrogenase family)
LASARGFVAMSGRVAGNAALVTGVAQGIGAEVARTLVREGAKALVTDINVEGVAAVADAINAELGPRSSSPSMRVAS